MAKTLDRLLVSSDDRWTTSSPSILMEKSEVGEMSNAFAVLLFVMFALTSAAAEAAL